MPSAHLLDIEGTTSSVSFVYDVLFPYARRAVGPYLERAWHDPDCAAARELLARDAGAPSFAAWSAIVGAGDEAAQRAALLAHVLELMRADSKATGLKALQGHVCAAGYTSGELRAHVYPDLLPALQRWTAAGRRVCIYSSGSIHAQKQFFGHSEAGNLLPYFSAHFDTTTGPKREAHSYRTIAAALAVPPAEILFASDVVEELDAARTAGLSTALALRPGNKPVSSANGHAAFHSFAELP